MSNTYSPPPDYSIDIEYIDDDLLIVNKPSGLLSVPGRGDDKQDCLINRILNQYNSTLIVHRLDMDTSGLMVLARNKHSHRSLSILFEKRNVKKKYTAIVDGIIEHDSGEINLPLITDWPNRPRQKVDHELGKASVTQYHVTNRNREQNYSTVELTPITGRSHQLRVHMKSLGHPILGDNLYADEEAKKKSSRLLLHSHFLEFIHPVTNKIISCELDIPF